MRLRALGILATLILVANPILAQATRTWVSGLGDDFNPCSRTAPCKTFAGAISKTAAKGQISVLDPGGYGAVTITKSLTIDGSGTLASILHSGANGVVINAESTDTVILINLRIDGDPGPGTVGLNGVSVVRAKAVVIENCIIMNSTKGVSVSNSSGTVNLVMTNTDITNETTNGVALLPTSTGVVNAILDGVRISRTGSTTSHDGIQAGANTNTHLRNTSVIQSAGAGFHLSGSFALATVETSSFVRNGSHGVELSGSPSQITVGNSNAAQNAGSGFHATSGTIFSYHNNLSSANMADSPSSLATAY